MSIHKYFYKQQIEQSFLNHVIWTTFSNKKQKLTYGASAPNKNEWAKNLKTNKI